MRTLHLLHKNNNFALFAIDATTESAIICFQGNPVEKPKNKVLRLSIEEARKEWKFLNDNNWSMFEKGMLPGAVIQRIMMWFRTVKKDSDEYEQGLKILWRASYDGTTPARKCRVENKDGFTKFFLTKRSYSDQAGFTLHPRIGIGANQGLTLHYISGTIPRQRGKKMR
jgi:hypothetical protein